MVFHHGPSCSWPPLSWKLNLLIGVHTHLAYVVPTNPLENSVCTSKGRTTSYATATLHLSPTISQQFCLLCPDSTHEQVHDHAELYPKRYQSQNYYTGTSCDIPFFSFGYGKMLFLSQECSGASVFLFHKHCNHLCVSL